ncbi:MAG: PASTA domain-containing protein [Rikenellaceae bacterium]|nr:PASTA domain-containing protein [Rikenellaceae bacterium]
MGRNNKAKQGYWQRLKQYPIIYNFVMIVMIVVGVLLVSAIAMHFGTRHGSHRSVPDFSGVQLADAEHAAKRRGLQIIVNDSLFVPAYEGGIILDQLPKSGAKVKAGRKVYVTINSLRQKMVKVPYVAGRSLRQAKNMLEVAGLEIERLEYVDDIATNYVLEEYCDGVQLTEESTIEAELGSGVVLKVGVQGGYGVAEMPKLIGLSLQRAKSRLWEMGFNVGKVIYDDDVDMLDKKDARVYYQSVDQGRDAELGSKIRLKLTLDVEKVAKQSAESDAVAKALIEERLAAERTADSLRNLENSVAEPTEIQQQETSNQDDFFI